MKKIKKIGIFNLLEENICTLKCNCGWNITIGGLDKIDLKQLKKFLKNYKKEYVLKK